MPAAGLLADVTGEAALHVVAPGEGTLGRLRILATAEHTRGAYFALEGINEPGEANLAPHLHEGAEEAEYVVSGEREIVCGERRLQAATGSFVIVPRRAPHAMRTLGPAASRWLHIFSPAGIERWFFERARLLAAGASPMELRTAAEQHDVRHEPVRPPDSEAYVRPPLQTGQHLLAPGSVTGGRYAVIERVLHDGFASPSHLLADVDEGFYVLAGELALTVDARTVLVGSGGFALVRSGVTRGFAVPGDAPAKFLVISSPPLAEHSSQA